jgi:glycogen debranching enzyme
MGTTSGRPTPADPTPGTAADRPSDPNRADLPADLGPHAIAVLDGRTFMYSDAAGDVPERSIGGLVHQDTRFLHRWVLMINGARLLPLRSAASDYYSAEFFLTNGAQPQLRANSCNVRRQRFVGADGLHERIDLQSFAAEPLHIELRMLVGTDFADLFEIKGQVVRNREDAIVREHAADGSRLSFRYTNAGFTAHTVVQVEPHAARVDGDELVWDMALGPGECYTVELHVPLEAGSMDLPSVRFRAGGEPLDDVTGHWHAQRAHLASEAPLLAQVMDKSADDILALRGKMVIGDRQVVVPSAGLPWFLTLFGRDTLITAYQSLGANPHLARGALIALAQFQGTRRDDFTDEDPGRILHELRTGELTQLGDAPHNPYYGTADATQLWLIVLSEYWRWTGDDELVRALRGNVVAALDWIDRYGDRDGDGYVDYATRSPRGLGNQCWRDSWDGVQFADGTIPVLPIATCEVQGYSYDAKRRVAELADGPLADPALAARLRGDAQLLRERFNRDFWIDERGGYYAIGLDGDKRRIDSMTSNMGHLLWSGIVPEARAQIVARQLMSDAMFSGWGIRTLSTYDRGYNPIGYHAGTVWPHDNSLIAVGLSRYGFRAEANRLCLALLDAAGSFGLRLPEVFAGYSRDYAKFPVPYPTPCSPQAWASGAPILLSTAMLGLDARDGRLVVDARIPAEIGRVSITGLQAFGKRWDIEAIGSTSHVRVAP